MMKIVNVATGAITAEVVPPVIDIQKAKLIKLRQIEHDRDEACRAPVLVDGDVWQADQASQLLLANAIRRGKNGKKLPDVWRTSDNKNIKIDNITQLEAIEDVIVAQVEAAYATSWQRKAALNAAITIEEVYAA